MKPKDYNGTPVPTQTLPIIQKNKKFSFAYDTITFTASTGEKIIPLSNTNIQYVEIRAITSGAMSIGTAHTGSFKIVQGCTKIVGGVGVTFSSSTNVLDAGGNTATVSKFRGNGIILNFSAVSGTITLQITSY